jgi:hypothetical protein
VTDAAEPRPSLYSRVSPWLAPALFLCAGLLQVVLAKGFDLAVWRGGGFGIFSTVDKADGRIFLAVVETPAGDRPVLYDSFDPAVRNAVSLPTQPFMERAAEFVAKEQEDGLPVRVEVWKQTFDPGTGENRRVKLASYRLERAR